MLSSWPNLWWGEDNVRFADVTGDGRPDILVSDVAALQWYRSLGEDGFLGGARVPLPNDEERGPRVLLADLRHDLPYSL